MLNGKLVLHDLQDVEWLCAGIIRQSGYELSFHEREDLLAFLVATCWELSRDFEQGRIRMGFRKYAAVTLQKRAADWVRSSRGRTVWRFADRVYERERPSLVAYEDGISGSVLDPDRGADDLGRAVRARSRYRARHRAILREAMCQCSAA